MNVCCVISLAVAITALPVRSAPAQRGSVIAGAHYRAGFAF